MIVQMQAGIERNDERVNAVITTAKAHGLRPVPKTLEGEDFKVVEIQLKNYKVKASSLSEHIFMLNGVDHVRRVKQRLEVSHLVQLGKSFFIGKDYPCALVVGPCTVDEYVDEIAKYLAELGIKAMRGGCWKPRSNPYSFRGYGEKAVRLLLEAATKHNMQAVFTEVMECRHIEVISRIKAEVGYKGTIVLWVGAHTESDPLLDELGYQKEFPVMLKNNARDRNVSYLLKNAERVLVGWNEGETPDVEHGLSGNSRILFCLRGTEKSGDPGHYRQNLNHEWTGELRAVADAPVGIDASHSAGTMKNDLVFLNCKSALIHKPDFLMLEGGYPAKGFKDGFRGHCDVDQSIPQYRLREVVKMVDEHNSTLSA